MRKKLSILVVIVFVLFTQEAAYALSSIDRPSETVVLKLPGYSHLNWKDITHAITKKMGLIERIPCNQTSETWSELICIQYRDRSDWDRGQINCIENIMDRVQEEAFSTYPRNKSTWRIIEKNKNDILYEWILHKQHNGVPPQHEVARAFLTETGFHSVAFTRKSAEMSPDERGKWIKLLKESASVVSFKEAGDIPDGISMVDWLKDSLDLGPVFKRWRVTNTSAIDSGWTMVCRVPISQTEAYITECLEEVTAPILNATSSIDQLFEMEKENAQKRSPKKVEFHILEKSSTEVIYSYSYPQDNLQVTAVARSFISNQAYYFIVYKRGLKEEIKKEDILKWKKLLEMIKICSGG